MIPFGQMFGNLFLAAKSKHRFLYISTLAESVLELGKSQTIPGSWGENVGRW